MSGPVIVVHGGAGSIPDSRDQQKFDGMCAAIRAAHYAYETTSSITEACQAAVECMEDDEAFNAGRGSVLNLKGEIEMEALFMEGKDMNAGSVTGVKNIAHPIALARKVMENTPHVLLMGQSANDFAVKSGFEAVPDDYLMTSHAKIALDNFLKSGSQPITTEIGQGSVGTVGAIGMDVNGHMVSCTSTGGITGKMAGRVGDTPIPGAGGYCNNEVGTISTTGHGDSIMRYCLASKIMHHLENGNDPNIAAQKACESMSSRVGGSAGAIVISKDGKIGIGFSSPKMAWAFLENRIIHYGIKHGQHLTTDL
ncbi:Asparaginase-like 1, metazoa,Peptidase T2, asparaginase 2,Nucleophile aminohydrolases, N-terminal [Cinara cedri]|uniref:Asparaginase-like 1, metazoa,Peptidase T2, asparaginase 2,Nucleophile aminohydrolases, N-terminal n=1 Tax=Cinara cedri TaxID=506608 RepID=A0A5E4M576_9HEMI|nr:Asparaginase-like 1, metazoa,Peptidase T2, asparaginase 2,Nucleophile aminohydrolases, N-terminal [Cinara cedri]